MYMFWAVGIITALAVLVTIFIEDRRHNKLMEQKEEELRKLREAQYATWERERLERQRAREAAIARSKAQ